MLNHPVAVGTPNARVAPIDVNRSGSDTAEVSVPSARSQYRYTSRSDESSARPRATDPVTSAIRRSVVGSNPTIPSTTCTASDRSTSTV